MRRGWLALPLALACAGTGTERSASREDTRCDAELPGAYTEEVAQSITARLQPRIEGPAKGTVRMFLRVTAQGQLVDAKIAAAPSPEIGELALAAAREAAPFPDLTRERFACALSHPVLVWVVYDVPRDCEAVPEVGAYLERLRATLAAADVAAGLPRGSASIWLRLAEQGALLDTQPTESIDAEAFTALSAALARSSPYEPPPAGLRDCLVDQPVLFQVVVP